MSEATTLFHQIGIALSGMRGVSRADLGSLTFIVNLKRELYLRLYEQSRPTAKEGVREAFICLVVSKPCTILPLFVKIMQHKYHMDVNGRGFPQGVVLLQEDTMTFVFPMTPTRISSEHCDMAKKISCAAMEALIFYHDSGDV